MSKNTDLIPPSTPWPLFAAWFAEAEKQEPSDPNAMSLATVGEDSMPSNRIVLLKDYDQHGFVFFTNRQSRKGEQLAKRHKASLCFHWKSLRRQIRIEGIVGETSDAESDDYFATRARGSQIGAWASLQSQVLVSREALEQRVKELEGRYEGRSVPRPPHWGGYRLAPQMIEFWQERDFRLHDRFVYRQQKGVWIVERQYP